MNSHGIESRKTRLARIVLILLVLAGMGAATLSTLALPFAPKNVATCHGHSHLPAKPADHLCCAVGHQQALLTKAVSVASPSPTLLLVPGSLLVFAPSEPPSSAANLHPSPPTAPPLRI